MPVFVGAFALEPRQPERVAHPGHLCAMSPESGCAFALTRRLNLAGCTFQGMHSQVELEFQRLLSGRPPGCTPLYPPKHGKLARAMNDPSVEREVERLGNKLSDGTLRKEGECVQAGEEGATTPVRPCLECSGGRVKQVLPGGRVVDYECSKCRGTSVIDHGAQREVPGRGSNEGGPSKRKTKARIEKLRATKEEKEVSGLLGIIQEFDCPFTKGMAPWAGGDAAAGETTGISNDRRGGEACWRTPRSAAELQGAHRPGAATIGDTLLTLAIQPPQTPSRNCPSHCAICLILPPSSLSRQHYLVDVSKDGACKALRVAFLPPRRRETGPPRGGGAS